MDNITPLVYIVILNYNGYEDTIECVNSLKKITYNNYKIVIVDNCSSDNSESILRNKFPYLTIIQSGGNIGFAGGNNIGIKHALENGADYVLLLNNDTLVEKDFLEPLVETGESDKWIGIIGGKIYYYEDKKIWYAGAKLNKFTGKTQHIGDRESDTGQYDKIADTGYVTGCLMLVKSNVIEEVGSMDENYFLYYEETDWNVRINKAGYRIVYNPNSIIYHKVSASTKKINIVMKYYYDRNVYYFVNKNFGICNRIFMYVFIRTRLLLKLIKAYITIDNKRKEIIKRTYRDIKSKKMGEYKA